MNFTIGALQQLAAEEHVIRHRATLPRIDALHACRVLGTTLEQFRQKGATVRVDRPRLDVKRVWASFAASHFELDALNGLEFRTLCSSEETALRPEFIRALERTPEKLKRARCLYGLVNNYFALWREMPEPDLVEGLLRTVFESYGGKNPVVKKWSSNKLLLSAQAAAALAEEICIKQNGVDEELKTYCVGPATKLGLMARASAAKIAGERFRQVETSQNEEWSLQYLQWVTEKVLFGSDAARRFLHVHQSANPKRVRKTVGCISASPPSLYSP